MNIHSKRDGDIVLLALVGRFDIHSSVPVWEAMQATFDSPRQPHIVIDMSGVDFVDAAALRTLVEARRQCEMQGGLLVLAALSPTARILFEMLGVDASFTITPTVVAAATELRAASCSALSMARAA